MWCYEGLPFQLRCALFFIAIAIAWFLVTRCPQLIRRANSRFRILAQRPFVGTLLVVLVSLGANLLLTTLLYPQPWIHDEFSYLLAADTFAHFRLTNPTPPLWEHFETFHTLSEPTYMSKYPPGNGLFLALGKLLTGHWISGTWIAMACALSALHWMFRAWLPSRWALFGALLLAIYAPMLAAWGQTYWGGAVPLLGGALLFGGMRRIVQTSSMLNASLFSIGAVTLAMTRPLEGVIACVFSGAVLLAWFLRRNEISFSKKLTNVAIPVLLIGISGLALIAINNNAVTGDAKKLPYSIHSAKYSAAPLVWWKATPSVKDYNNDRLRRFYVNWSRERHREFSTPTGYIALVQKKLILLWKFYPLLGGICFLTLPIAWRNRWMKYAFLAIIGLLLIEMQLATNYAYPHYLAPLAGLFFVLTIQCLRHWRAIGRKIPIARILPVATACYVLLTFAALVQEHASNPIEHPRAKLEKIIGSHPGKHLVVVSYPEDYTWHREWVYNGAEFSEQQILWARELTADSEEKLASQFSDRTIWYWTVGTGIDRRE